LRSDNSFYISSLKSRIIFTIFFGIHYLISFLLHVFRSLVDLSGVGF
jgi:hypothetical protein